MFNVGVWVNGLPLSLNTAFEVYRQKAPGARGFGLLSPDWAHVTIIWRFGVSVTCAVSLGI